MWKLSRKNKEAIKSSLGVALAFCLLVVGILLINNKSEYVLTGGLVGLFTGLFTGLGTTVYTDEGEE